MAEQAHPRDYTEDLLRELQVTNQLLAHVAGQLGAIAALLKRQQGQHSTADSTDGDKRARDLLAKSSRRGRF